MSRRGIATVTAALAITAAMAAPAKKAKKQLRAAGWGVKVKKRRASGKKRGRVLAQKPRKGQTVPPGTTVKIFVGS